jgi:photosystem II stability/assembly factor-like uncharacterized protein
MCTRRLRKLRHALARALLVAAVALPGTARAVFLKDNLYGVKAMSASEAWAVGNFGSIYHTTDAGRTWTPRNSGSRVPLFAVDFANAQDGWIVGKSALILHTADGGKTWTPQKSPIPPEKHLFKLAAVDGRTAWAVGDWGAMTVTHDAGQTWEDRSLGIVTVKVDATAERTTNTITDDIILNDVSFPDPRHGFVAGEFGTLLVTADGGQTWEKREVGTEKTLFGVCFVSADEGWVVGIDGLILHTHDGGRSWDVQHGAAEAGSIEDLGFLETLKNPGLYGVEVRGQYGVVVGDTGKLMISENGGKTWTSRELPEKQRLVWLRGVSIVPGTHGFVVGANGFSAGIDRDRLVLTEDSVAPAPDE